MARGEAYAAAGPLALACGLAGDGADARVDVAAVGERICADLGFDAGALTEQQARRVYHYYVPVYAWVERLRAAKRAAGDDAPLVVGLSAPQGCGKTTITEELIGLFATDGRAATCVSVDDFYLTYEEQTALAAAEGNPLLEYRGNAGSHDLKLGASTLRAGGGEVRVPRYDKTAFSGRGTRAPEDDWPSVAAPLDVVLFEGWMLGFAPVGAEAARAVSPDLEAVDARLEAYAEELESVVDAWLVVKIGDPNWVFKWRQQAEEAARAAGKPTLTDDEVRDFVMRYQPAYEAYLPGLYADGPRGAVAAGKTVLMVEVEEDRSVKEA
eukprot:PRCOL_00005044-RA